MGKFNPNIKLNFGISNSQTSIIFTLCLLTDPKQDLAFSTKSVNINDANLIESHQMDINGFDEPFTSEEGHQYLTGSISYKYCMNGVEKILLLAEPKFIIGNMRNRIGPVEINECRNKICQSINEAFKNATISLYHPQDIIGSDHTDLKVNDSPLPRKSLANIKSSFRKNWLVMSIVVFAGLSANAYFGLLIYEKSLQIKNQQHLNNAMDPKLLAQDQEEMLNKVFADMGIDRSKIQSDMGCFAE